MELFRNAIRVWIALGDQLGRINLAIILTILYFCVVWPLGMALRITRRLPIELGNPRVESYWRPRRITVSSKAMEKAF